MKKSNKFDKPGETDQERNEARKVTKISTIYPLTHEASITLTPKPDKVTKKKKKKIQVRLPNVINAIILKY